jgi:hypothetical protein
MKSLNNIPIPKHLQGRPLWRGLPIPYIALVRPDGTPDFRVTDEATRRRVMMNGLCQLCGERLGKWVFFVGGTEAAKANAYFEPAAHLDCLLYAMQVCPFIAGKIEHADLDKIQAQYANPIGRTATHEGVAITVHADDTFATKRNPLWVIKKARGWSYVKTRDGVILCVPTVFKATGPLHAETMNASDWADVRGMLL